MFILLHPAPEFLLAVRQIPKKSSVCWNLHPGAPAHALFASGLMKPGAPVLTFLIHFPPIFYVVCCDLFFDKAAPDSCSAPVHFYDKK